MEATALSPMERKEKFLQDLEQTIVDKFSGGNLTAKFETCSSAPAFGWSVEEYSYMPMVAQRLRAKGYTVTSKVNWEVTDWLIAL